MKPPVARISIVAWIERDNPSPTEVRILHLPYVTLAFCGFSTPGASGKAGGERGRGAGYREGEDISEAGGGFSHTYRSGDLY